MARLILLFAIVALVYLLIKSYRRNLPEKEQPVVEDMVRCAQCGVHIPVGESIRAGSRSFCCAAHRDQFKQ